MHYAIFFSHFTLFFMLEYLKMTESIFKLFFFPHKNFFSFVFLQLCIINLIGWSELV